MKIRFCANNKGKGALIRRLEEEFPDLKIKVKECIKQCSICRDIPVATIDGDKVSADNFDELYLRIVARIRSV